MSDLRIAEMPEDERPRERMMKHGAPTLSDAELIAILLGSGIRGRSAIAVARDLLTDGLQGMSRREWGNGERVVGIGTAKAARLAAAFEIGRRLAVAANESIRDPIRDATVIARTLIARYSHHVQERLGAVYLDAKNRIIREREIYVGTLNATTVSTRDVLRYALMDHAAAVIIFHNHPSGDPSPSSEDLLFTKRMVEAGRVMGVEVMDHLILGANRYVSLKQRGVM
ncbi:MAG TPA: DNA repair protein RadC [Thermoanaerobaculia bacterium]|nr:DNA repair protein RadC [Thermoanaerobaculia bacterium]